VTDAALGYENRCSFARFEILSLFDSSFAQVCHEGNWIHRIRQEVDASLRTSTL